MLEKDRIALESAIEKSRKGLKEQQALNTVVESSGAATAEAKARAAAAEIEGKSAVLQASLHAEASQVEAHAKLEQTEAAQRAELNYMTDMARLEVAAKEARNQIEAEKFRDIVNAIGAGTIAAIARAGPEMQAKLLNGLGLKSLLVSDGKSPVNLFNTASGLIAPNTLPQAEKDEAPTTAEHKKKLPVQDEKKD